MKRDDWTVGDHAIRPAGKPDECFYCHQKEGDQHGPECVIRSRTVVIELKIQYTTVVPEAWSVKQIEFHLNESSQCSDNQINELHRLINREGGAACSCQNTEIRYIREATAEDEEALDVRVEKQKA